MSNYWNHSSKIVTLVNQDDHAAPIRSPVRGRTGFSKSISLRASVPFFHLPHPLPSTFLLSPHFRAALMRKTPSCGSNFLRLVRKRLLLRQNVGEHIEKLQSDAMLVTPSKRCTLMAIKVSSVLATNQIVAFALVYQ